MKSLIPRVVTAIGSLLKRLQVQQFLALVLVGLLFLSTNLAKISASSDNQNLGEKVQKIVRQDDSQRPKTTGEWQQEAREVEGSPGERLKNIAEESAEAIKDFGSLYPDTAESTVQSQPDQA